MSKILKNTTGSAISLKVLGLPDITATGQITIEEYDYTALSFSDSINYLSPLITAGDIVVNDGINNLTAANAIAYLKYPHAALSQRFLSSPERLNDFQSKTTQEAIEEVGEATNPLRVPISLIFNGTISNGNFIGYSNLLPGDETPVIVPVSGTLVEFTWSNKKDSCDFALEFRRNSTTATPFYTWSVDNTRFAAIVLPSPEPFSLGDRIYVKYIDQGTNAADAAIILLFKS